MCGNVDKIKQQFAKRSQVLALVIAVCIGWKFDISNKAKIGRAAEAVALDRYLQLGEHHAPIGACFHGVSLLPHLLSDAHCQPPENDWLRKIRRCLGIRNITSSPSGWQDGFIFLDWVLKIVHPKYCANCVEKNPSGIPEVSIIMTLFNNERLAIQAIFEIFLHSKEVNGIEFIIVDDGSTEKLGQLEEFLEWLKNIFGITHHFLRNSHSKGFSAANNLGVQHARGEYVLFANTDMFVTKGALGLLKATFERSETIAAVGPMFLGKYNVIQELGGIIYNNASAANAGRGIHLPPISLHRVREVDYISAACLMVRRRMFLKVGGFDEIYGKGYYEDTDLAMAFRKSGFSVILQPFAVVYHQEGSSVFGADSDLKKELMTRNKQLFYSKWEEELKGYCPPSVGQDASLRTNSLRVAYIEDTVPQPDRDSGSQRSFLLCKALIENKFLLTFFYWFERNPKYIALLQDLGVIVVPSHPISIDFASNGGHCKFDVFIIARRDTFNVVIDKVREQCPHAKVIFDTVDLHFLREARDYLSYLSKDTFSFDSLDVASVLDWITNGKEDIAERIRRKRDREISLMKRADLTLVVSHVEASLLKTLVPLANVHVVSNVYKLSNSKRAVPTFNARHGAMFVGSFNHPPNKQAIDFLLKNVDALRESLPKEERSAFELHIVSSSITQEYLLQAAYNPLQFKIYRGVSTKELEALYDHVRVVLAPLLSGAGVKGKIAEAWLHNVPIVTTPIGAEGMHGQHGTAFLLANSSYQFWEQFQRAYTNSEVWKRLSLGGIQILEENFSYEIANKTLLESFDLLGVMRSISFGDALCGYRR